MSLLAHKLVPMLGGKSTPTTFPAIQLIGVTGASFDSAVGNVTLPSGRIADDVSIISITTRNATPATPSGYTLLLNHTITGSGNNEFHRVYGRTLLGTEGSTFSYSRTDHGTDGAQIICSTWRNALLPGWVGDVSGGTTLTCPSVTGREKALLICAVGSALSGSLTSDPAGMTLLMNRTAGGNGTLQRSAYQALTAAGATGTKTFGGSASSNMGTSSLVLRWIGDPV